MTSGLADNVRKYRRTAGFSQEGLAEASDLSLSTVRKVEQGGDARVETLHALARALGVTTSALFVTEAPRSVVGPQDDANRQHLAELRRALMPPIGLLPHVAELTEASELDATKQRVRDARALYEQDRYSSVAKMLPGLLRSSEAAVAALEGEDQQHAVKARSQVLLMTGQFLTQVRQYDMGYYALAEAIKLAKESDQTHTAATGVVGMCWLLLRQDRFDECEALATQTAAEIEPRLSSATTQHLAIWGELWLRVAASARRNNRPDEAKHARRMAASAAEAMGREDMSFPDHWGGFGPATAKMKAIEDALLDGDARGVIRQAGEEELSAKGLRMLGGVTANNWNRHRLDVARAHVLAGAHQDAVDELTSIKSRAAGWLTHQPMAAHIVTDLLATRKRTLTQEMREMAAHLGVTG
ncbi:helix-turn-helix domain-containing protein [Streptomyces finlayi]|uniref:Helix-turn-helix domain-containing protein n=1 Tax=Streptomyces finlayi TaxID=67296 RepID=A0A7G7BFB3_9ACTN|nr:helix-turn-helix transcriptional regulator [Streptomyces finlayi]QNE74028.1 helix-turn-helix domain-containing protein [Streptomyces finlayi]